MKIANFVKLIMKIAKLRETYYENRNFKKLIVKTAKL